MTSHVRYVAAALSLLIFAGACGAVDLGRQVDFAIPAQKLDAALMEFSRQARVQVIAATAQLQDLKSSGAQGSLTLSEALKKLLANSGLVFKSVGDSAVSIGKFERGLSDNGRVLSTVPDEGLRLVRVDTTTARVQSGAEEAASSKDKQAEAAAQSQGIPEILVKGRRSLNTDIQRTEDAPQPYVVFDGKEIERSQAVNLEEFFRTRLPMNTAASNPVPGAPNTVSSINLRGLGANQTLVLVDGRRLPSSVTSLTGTANQADLNGIPLSSIERIEVLPSTASGIYGGSATGGVINIILRRDFQGIETKASYLNTFDTDASTTRLDASGGFNLEGGRTQVTVAASYSQANNLLLGDRDFTARAIGLLLANNPIAITGATTPPLGATVNIRSVSGNLVLDSAYGGTALGSNITHLPLGYAGPASDSGAALVANAGRYNLGMPAGVNGAERHLTGAPAMESATLNVRREFGRRFDVFLDFSRLGNKGTNFAIEAPNLISNLPASAPNNPFQQAIVVRFPSPGLSAENHNSSTTARIMGGIIARLPRDWTSELDYSWNRSRFSNVGTNALLQDVATCVLGRGLAASVDPDGAGPLLPCAAGDTRPALNALQEGNVFPIDFSAYRMPSPSNFQGPYDTVLKDTTLRLSGPAAQLPAGPLRLSALIERREEDIGDSWITDVASFSLETVYLFYPSRSQEADSYYLEAQAPLISARNALPLLRELTLQVSGRHDTYRTRSTPVSSLFFPGSRDDPLPPLTYTASQQQSTDYTVALRYAPVEDFILRASVGTGFLPPSVTQIASSSSQQSFNLGNDPKRGNTPSYVGTPFTYISGGNPDLKPENSKSWSAGFILTPRIAPGLRLSVDYTRISKVDEIQGMNTQFLLNNEEGLPGRIVRGARLATDPVGWLGPITSINLTLINIARTETQAYDVQLDYSLDTERFGDFRLYAIGTYQPHYRNQLLPTSVVTDRSGFADLLQWRGNLGVDWNQGPWTFGWNAQLYDETFSYTSTASAATIVTVVRNQGSTTIPSQIYHDLIATYRFGGTAGFARGLLANMDLSIGIQNLFDTSPPIIATTQPVSAGISLFGDPRLRRYSVSVRKGFGN